MTIKILIKLKTYKKTYSLHILFAHIQYPEKYTTAATKFIRMFNHDILLYDISTNQTYATIIMSLSMDQACKFNEKNANINKLII
jgi:hypothetical protein